MQFVPSEQSVAKPKIADDVLRFIEKRMLANVADEVDFDDLIGIDQKKGVAATAFVSINSVIWPRAGKLIFPV